MRNVVARAWSAITRSEAAGRGSFSGGALGVLLVARARAHVNVYLAARTARACVTHLPEVVLHPHGEDALFGNADLDPIFFRFVVAGDTFRAFEDGGVEPLAIDAV